MPTALRTFTTRSVVSDALALAVAAIAVGAISPTQGPSGVVPSEPLQWSFSFCLAVLLVGTLRGDHRVPLRPDLSEAIRQSFSTTAVAAILTITGRVVLVNDTFVAAETIRHWAVALPAIIAARLALLAWEGSRRRRGEHLVPTMIVGAGHVGQRIANRLRAEPEIGLLPVVFLDRAPQASADLPVHLFDCDLEAIVREHGIREAIVAFAYGGDSSMPDLARRLWQLGVSVKVVPRLFELGGEQSTLAFLGAMPVAVIRPVNPAGWRIHTKYALDRVIAALALLLLAPLMLAISMAVAISLGRPLLYRQLRRSNDGRTFWMLKFRTMCPSGPGEPEADAAWAMAQQGLPVAASDAGGFSRCTAVGRFLRRTSLDELPQLINVLKGELSLIGPRPERVAYADAFEQTVRRYSDRHRVRSGLTGWAQVSGLRGRTSLEDRVEWDNHYIDHWSPWLDLKILLLTVPRLIRRPGV